MGASRDAALKPDPLPAPAGERRARPIGPAIEARGVSKTYRIPRHRESTLKERALHPFRRIPALEIPAARDVSFEIAEGEFFGIVGRNGSGKSTLLKMLAGIYQPDAGTIRTSGTISPFIELGVGFNPELEARDNVIINGNMLGLTRREMIDRYPEIIRFAELEEFEDMKLKNYSSGMLVRLAFSTAIQVDAEILLLDEVLAVGDAGFQAKCLEAFRRLKREGKTIVLVTHAMELVRRLCDRALLLERGGIVAIGDTDEVSERYRELATADVPGAVLAQAEPGRFGDGRAEAREVWIEDSSGRRRDVVQQGEPIVLCARYGFKDPFRAPHFGIIIRSEAGFDVFAMNTLWSGIETPDFEPGDEARLRIEIDNHLGVGAYTLTPGVAKNDGNHTLDLRFNLAGFRVEGRRWTGAVADLPYEIDLERRPGGGEPA